jgi:hypothetical protein
MSCPNAAGGLPTVENIELRCRAHNGYEAEVFFAPAKRYAGADVVREAAAAYRCVSSDAFRSRTKVAINCRHDPPRPASAG